MRIKIAAVLVIVALLSGCGTSSKVEIKNLVIPTSCTDTQMLSALNAIVPDSLDIPTQWKPAPGTDLADVLNNGGIACSYGRQSEEIGITIKWVSDAKGLFEARTAEWKKSGFTLKKVKDLPGATIYFHMKKQSETQEFHIWEADMKYGGAWIQLNCTAFAQDFETGIPLLKAAVAA